jgi:hypothetical protein
MSNQILDTLKLPNDCMVVFIDDTGDPAYRDQVNPVFGLGGCAVLVRDLDPLIRQPWARVRTIVGGRAGARLHATSVERRMTRRKETAIRAFFSEQPFGRLAYISSASTQYAGTGGVDDVIVRSTLAVLLRRIVEVAKWMPFSSIAVIFEQSEHLTPRLEAASNGLQFEEDGRVIPHEWYVLQKSVGEPGLEVADFMMHTVAGYCRSGRDPQSKFAARFSAIFGVTDDRLCSFMEGTDVTYTPAA